MNVIDPIGLEPIYNSEGFFLGTTSEGFTGETVIQKCQGGSCVTQPCKLDRKTGLYEEGCEFIPHKDQREKASIMYSQSIDTVSAMSFFFFCS